MYIVEEIDNQGFGARVNIGSPITIKRMKIVEYIPDEPTEFMKKRKADIEESKRRNNKGQLIDMNSLLDWVTILVAYFFYEYSLRSVFLWYKNNAININQFVEID